MFTIYFWPAFDLQPAADLLARAQSQGRPIANWKSYDGQFHFLGRLTTHYFAGRSARGTGPGLQRIPGGMLIAYTNHPAPGTTMRDLLSMRSAACG